MRLGVFGHHLNCVPEIDNGALKISSLEMVSRNMASLF
jgi:hypothetical protein